MKRTIAWYVMMVVQVLLIVGIVINQMAIEAYGKSITLRTVPVDPRDILYGNYVRLNYDISRLPIGLLAEKGVDPDQISALYVVLKPEGDLYHAVSLHTQKPETATDEVVLKARVDQVLRGVSNDAPNGITFALLYGLERYYVTEKTGFDLEKKRGQFNVIAKVSPWGQKLSSLSFIATDVLTEEEIREKLNTHYSGTKKFTITDIRLVSDVPPYHRPCWIATVSFFDQKAILNHVLTLDAKTGEILQENQ